MHTMTLSRADWMTVHDTFDARWCSHGRDQDRRCADLICQALIADAGEIVTIAVPMALWAKRVLTWPDWDEPGTVA